MQFKKLTAFLTAFSMTFGLIPFFKETTAVQASAENISSIDLVTVSNRNFYFSYDPKPFEPAELIDLSKTYATDENGETVNLDIEKFTFGTPERGEDIELSPKSIFDSGYYPAYTNTPLLVFYDGQQLASTIDICIGVKGDVNFDGTANAEDASMILIYAAREGSGEEAYIFSDTDEMLESFAYFLADTDGESKDRGITSGVPSDTYRSYVSAADASQVLIYAAKYGANGRCDWIPTVLSEPYPEYSSKIAEYIGLIESSSTEQTRSLSPARSAQGIRAKSGESISVTIDQKTVTPEQAKSGVPIYVRVDNAVLNAIEFGTHVDDRAEYEIVTYPRTAMNVGGEQLDVSMTYEKSSKETNMAWYTFASVSPDSDIVTFMQNGEKECMNLVMLNVKIPDPIPGEVYNIEYLSSGVTSPDGYASVEIWRNTFAGTTYRGLSFDTVDYVASGAVSVTDGWIKIESDTPAPTQPVQSNRKGDIDGDGTISIVDVLTLNQYLLGVDDNVSAEGIAAADVNGDKLITDADAMMILKSLVGLATLPE